MKCDFGAALKEARIAKGLTLRQFCKDNKIDAGNQSKYERNLLPPPRDPVIVVGWLKAMGYSETERTWAVVMTKAWVKLCEIIEDDYDRFIKE